jgi:hypothetical protein
MAEFADLCRMEALLERAGKSQVCRDHELSRLLSEPPPAGRAFMKEFRRPVRWSAAAALLAVGFGLTGWKAGWFGSPLAPAVTGNTLRPLPSLRPPGAGMREPVAAKDTGTEAEDDPKIGGELRQLLERLPMIGFHAHGPLAEVIAAQLASVQAADGTTIPIVVADEGDSGAALDFDAVMPAWHLLKMLAIQTGTQLSLEDGSLVFRRAENPASQETQTNRTARLVDLRALLGLRAGDAEDNQPDRYSSLTARITGADVRFEPVSTEKIRISGAARDIRILTSALDGALSLPPSISLNVALVTVPADARYAPPPLSASLDSAIAENVVNAMNAAALAGNILKPVNPGLSGVFTPPQTNQILRALLQPENGGVLYQALLDQPVIPNQESLAQTNRVLSGGLRIDTTTSILAKGSEGDTVDLDINSITGAFFPDGKRDDHLGIRSQALLWYGQTAILSGFRQPDGSTMILLLTATQAAAGAGGSTADSDNTPESGKPDSATSATVATPAAGEMLTALPVTGKRGLVTSPYTTLPVEFDVSCLKSGSTLTCPLTGKPFRIP